MHDKSIPDDRPLEDHENVEIESNKEEYHPKAKPSWHPVYPKSLTKSMKAIISATRTRVEEKSIKQEEDPSEDQEVFSKLLNAIQRKEKEEITGYVSNHVSLLEKPNERGRLPLHLICELTPNYFYVDLIEMIVQKVPDATGTMDQDGKTPLHILCINSTVNCSSIMALVSSLAACAAMPDKNSNIPLHYLCSNSACTLDMIGALGAFDTYGMKNDSMSTPLHLLAKVKNFNKEAFLHLLKACPDAATVIDTNGRTVLHWLCENPNIDEELLNQLVPSSSSTLKHVDNEEQLPLHLLCQNDSINMKLLAILTKEFPSAVYERDNNGATPLHYLCVNESITADMLGELLSLDKRNSTIGHVDKFGAAPLHLLSMNTSLNADILRMFLLYCTNESFVEDIYGKTPLHHLCMNSAISPELLWLFFDHAMDSLKSVDYRGKTPLHLLCSNHKVSQVVLEIVFDAYPNAALLNDNEMRLPVQYLVDNSNSSPEVSSLLISGPLSYRHRYEFIGSKERCAASGGGEIECFRQNHETVYLQSCLAIDSTTSLKVAIKFFSSTKNFEHVQDVMLRLCDTAHHKCVKDFVDCSLPLYDVFNDATRRVTLRKESNNTKIQTDDMTITMHDGIVTEAPTYTLDAILEEKVEDKIQMIHRVISELGDSLYFFHDIAQVIHGNLCLKNIGHFPHRGLRLLNFSTSRFIDDLYLLDANAFSSSFCSPEAAKAFVGGESFQPTFESDMWQFGCIIYTVATGKTIVERLSTWCEALEPSQIFHLICSLNDYVLDQLLSEVHPRLQTFLSRLLVINPLKRCSISRLMDELRDPDGFWFLKEDEDILDQLSQKFVLQSKEKIKKMDEANEAMSKHVKDQLEFVQNEKNHMRDTLLSTRHRLRQVQEERDLLMTQIQQMTAQLDAAKIQRQEAKLEAQVFARNHQAMTHQLHTTVQMLLNLIPLARKVYGSSADEFLSGALSHAAGMETEDFSLGQFGTMEENKAIRLVKNQLQNSIFAYGCVQTWANSNTSSVLGKFEQQEDLVEENQDEVELQTHIPEEEENKINQEKNAESPRRKTEDLITTHHGLSITP